MTVGRFLVFFSVEVSLHLDVAGKLVDSSQSSRELEDLQREKDDRTWHRFRAGLGGSDAFVSRIILVYNFSLLFFMLYCSVHTWDRRENGFLSLLVTACGLLGSVRSEDTW